MDPFYVILCEFLRIPFAPPSHFSKAAWSVRVGKYRVRRVFSTGSGAHNPERVTFVRPCHGVFTDQFFFLECFGVNFEYLLNSTNQSAKPTHLKRIFFCLLITFSFPF